MEVEGTVMEDLKLCVLCVVDGMNSEGEGMGANLERTSSIVLASNTVQRKR